MLIKAPCDTPPLLTLILGFWSSGEVQKINSGRSKGLQAAVYEKSEQ